MPQYYNQPSGGSGSTTSSPYIPAETTLNLDDPAVLTAGLLTIPVSATNYGIYKMTGASASYTVSKIANVPVYEIELRTTPSATTVTFNGVAEASATTNDLVIETAGPIPISGAGDYLKLRKTTGEVFNRKTGASTYA